MSELKSQISKLREQYLPTQSLSHGRASLFLSPKEAASVDVDTIRESAVNGLKAIIQYDSRFSAYLTTIFHQSTISLQRELKTKAENIELDKQLHDLLYLLAPYVLEPSCHTVLEYLIRRYRINDLNIDSLMAVVLPRHDNKIFVKVVQLCSFGNNSKWSFLEGIKQSGTPILRSRLLKQCRKDISLLEAICKLVYEIIWNQTSLKESDLNSIAINGYNSIVSFYCAVLVEMLDQTPLNDSQLRVVLPSVFNGLKLKVTVRDGSNHPCIQYRRSCCMVLIQIARKTILAGPLKQAIASSLFQSFYDNVYDDSILDKENYQISTEILSSLVVISQYHELNLASNILTLVFSDKSTDMYGKLLLERLSCLKKTMSITSLISSIVRLLIAVVVPIKTTDVSPVDSISSDDALTFVLNIISQNFIEPEFCEDLVIMIVVSSIRIRSDTSIELKCIPILQSISQRFPETFDLVLQKLINEEYDLNNYTDGDFIDFDDRNVKEFVTNLSIEIFSSSKHRLFDDNGKMMLLALRSPSPIIRVEALKKFSSFELNHDINENDGVFEAVCQNLDDTTDIVAAAAWDETVITKIVEHFAVFDIVSSFYTAWKYWSNQVTVLHCSSLNILQLLLKSLQLPRMIDLFDDARVINIEENYNIIASDWLLNITLSLLLTRPLFKSIPNDNAIESMAVEVLNNLSHRIPLLTNFTYKSSGDREAIQSDIYAVICRNILTRSKECCEVLYRLTSHATKVKDASGDTSYLLTFFHRVLNGIRTKSDVKAEKLSRVTAIQSLLRMILPVVLVMIDKSQINADSDIEYLNDLITEIIECLEYIHIQQKAVNLVSIVSMQDCLSQAKLGFSSVNDESIAIQLLLGLLASDKYIEFIAKLLISYFAQDRLFILLRVLLSNHYSSSDVKFNEGVDSGNIDVSLSTRIGAMHVIGSLIGSLAVNNADLSVNDKNVLFCLFPVVIHACMSSLSAYRAAGIALAGKIALFKDSSANSTISVFQELISLQDLGSLSYLIYNNYSAISLDAGAISLMSKDVLIKSEANLVVFSSLINIIGLEIPHLSSALLKFVASGGAIEVSKAWKYLKSFFNVESRGSRCHYLSDTTASDIQSIVSSLLNITTVIFNRSQSEELLLDIVAACCSCVKSNNNRVYYSQVLRNEIIQAISVFKVSSKSTEVNEDVLPKLFDALIQELSINPGNKAIIQAVSALELPISLLNMRVNSQISLFVKEMDESVMKVDSIAENDMDIDEDEMTNYVSALSGPLEKLTGVIEVISAIISNKSIDLNKTRDVDSSQSLNQIISISMQLFQKLNHRALTSLLTLEFALTVVLELLIVCFNKLMPDPASTSVGNRLDNVEYNTDSIENDVRQLLDSLSRAKTISLQSTTLKLIKILIEIKPEAIESCISLFGELLATSSYGIIYSSREELLKSILSSFIQTRSSMSLKSSLKSAVYLPQDTIQPFGIHFGEISMNKRVELIKIVLSCLGPAALPALTTVLLTHAVISYDRDHNNIFPSFFSNRVEKKTTQVAETLTAMLSKPSELNMIVLSRAAQKKAHRLLVTSTSEDIFRQSIELTSSLSCEIQISNLVVQMKLVQYMIQHSIQYGYKSKNDTINEIIIDDYENLDAETILKSNSLVNEDYGDRFIVDATKSLKYFSLVYNRDKTKYNTTMNSIDNDDVNPQSALALGLLTLEYVTEIVRNKSFHRSILQLKSDDNKEDLLHQYFLEFVEEILELLSLAGSIQVMSASAKQSTSKSFTVLLGHEYIEVNAFSMGKTIESQVLELLQHVQRLLDAPTFVQVMEELLIHENQNIRHKSLQILAQRLEIMENDPKSISIERPLFLDLMLKLRQTIQGTLPSIQSSLTLKPTVSGDKNKELNSFMLIENPQIRLCQSALLCIDAVARNIPCDRSSSVWMNGLSSTLNELVQLASTISQITTITNEVNLLSPTKKKKKTGLGKESNGLNSSAIKLSASYTGLVKLLGSVFLACGTLAGSIGPKALPNLSLLMSTILTDLKYHFNELISPISLDSTVANIIDEKDKLLGLTRSRVLLIRSIIAAITSIIQSIPQFMHPYIERTLSLIIPCHEASDEGHILPFNELEVLTVDVDNCLQAIGSKIPIRLLLPCIVNAMSATTATNHQTPLFAFSHHCSYIFIKFFHSICLNLDRIAVSNYVSYLSTLATLVLDYRRVYGDQTDAANVVDEIAVAAVVELSLKFTEMELKSFLTGLFDWKDCQFNSNKLIDASEGVELNDKINNIKDWRAYSRGVTFYHLISGLASKLQHIFLPSMSILWTSCSEMIKELSSFIATSSDIVTSLHAITDSRQQTPSKIKKAKRKRELVHEFNIAEFSLEYSDSKLNLIKQVRVEMIERSRWTLLAVRSSSSFDDNNQFIDENRFSVMMPQVVSLLALLHAFDSVDEYYGFCEDYAIPCLIALAVAVNKDLQWKPMNYKILMLLRDTNKDIRIIALKTLQRLYMDVGEEYLLMLPECLPFLSELLEDDDSDVVNLTNQVIKHIEDTSGEKLESYLQ